MTGLGGAYSPIGEGVLGFTTNAAAPAVRPLWSRTWFDWDWDLGVTFPSVLSKTDFDNNGSAGFRYSRFLFATAGLNLQFGDWGVGANLDAQTYQLGQSGGDAGLELQLGRLNVLAARSFFQGQLVIGGGARIASFALDFLGA